MLPKYITQQKVQELATQSNISTEEVVNILKKKGHQIEGVNVIEDKPKDSKKMLNNFQINQVLKKTPKEEQPNTLLALTQAGYKAWDDNSILGWLGNKANKLGATVTSAVLSTPKSAFDLAKSVGHAVTNPLDTLGALGKTAYGLSLNASEIPSNLPADIPSMPSFAGTAAEIAPDLAEESKTTANAVISHFGDRYGSWEQAVKTFETDPVGMISDILSFTGLGGSALKATGAARTGARLESIGALDPVNIATNKAIQGTSSMLNRLGSASPEAMAVAQATKQVAPDLQTVLPKSIKGNSQLLQSVEKFRQNAIFGVKDLTDKVNQSLKKIEEYKTSQLSQLTKGKSRLELGNVLKEAMDINKNKVQDTQEALYKLFDAKVAQAEEALPGKISGLYPKGGSIADVVSLEKTTAKINELASRTTGAETMNAPLRNLLDNIQQDITSAPDKFQALRNTASKLFKKTQDKLDPIATGDLSALKSLEIAVRDDIDNTIVNFAQKTGDSELLNVYQNASKYYKDQMKVFNSKIGETVRSSNPESLYKLVKSNQATDLKTLKAVVGDEVFGEVKGTFLSELAKQASKKGSFDMKQFVQKAKELDEDTLNALFNPEQRQRLNEVLTDLSNYNTVEEALVAMQKGYKLSPFMANFLGGAGALGAISQIKNIFANIPELAGLGMTYVLLGRLTDKMLLSSEWMNKLGGVEDIATIKKLSELTGGNADTISKLVQRLRLVSGAEEQINQDKQTETSNNSW